jgi:EmrB/QacA subfamily drug resistance transporter
MRATVATTTADATTERLPRDLVKLALALMLGAIMVALDMTVVNVALQTLVSDFHSSVATIQWVSTAYLLALATVIPVSGWAVERYGARTMWTVSIVLFITGSVLSGLAWSAGSLIAFRALQGLGGGMIIPLIQTILAHAAGPDRVGRVMAVVGVPAMLGPVLGPVLGGLIVSEASWRLIFFINVPICVAALVAARNVVMPDTKRAEAFRLDLAGLALLSPALVSIVYGLSRAATYGGFANAHVLVPVAIGIALLLGFAIHALRMRGEPIIDLRLFRDRRFASFSAIVFFFSMAMLGAALLLPLYYQQVRGEDALHAGLLLAPQGLGMAIALIAVSRLADRIDPRAVILSGLALTAGALAVYTSVAADTSIVLLSAAAFVSGAGIGGALVPAMAGAYAGLPREALARATSSIRVFQQLGGSFGIAILAVVLERQTATHAHADTASLASAYGNTFWFALAFTALALIPTLLLPRVRRGTGKQSLEASPVSA